jgi:hypothetical protein
MAYQPIENYRLTGGASFWARKSNTPAMTSTSGNSRCAREFRDGQPSTFAGCFRAISTVASLQRSRRLRVTKLLGHAPRSYEDFAVETAAPWLNE